MKPKREITLGEMKDECIKHSGERTIINGTCIVVKCNMQEVCPYKTLRSFANTDLTDPPRFTEAQMALFRWWYERGAVWAGLDWNTHVGDIVVFRGIKDQQIGTMQNTDITLWFKENESFLDLAELFGKEGTK